MINVDLLIMQEMTIFCQAAPQRLASERIHEFTQHYGFTSEDFSQQTLRRAYVRYATLSSGHPFHVQLNDIRHILPTHTPILA